MSRPTAVARTEPGPSAIELRSSLSSSQATRTAADQERLEILLRQPERPDDADNVRGIRAFNDHAAADDRVELTMLTIGDGLTFARRR